MYSFLPTARDLKLKSWELERELERFSHLSTGLRTWDQKLCLAVIICRTTALHSPRLRRQVDVSSPGHTGRGLLIPIALLKVLYPLIQQVPTDPSLGITDLHLVPVLLTPCGIQRIQQQNVLRLARRPLLQVKTI